MKGIKPNQLYILGEQMERGYKVFLLIFYSFTALCMVGSLFIPEAIFSNKTLNNAMLSTALIWMLSPPILELLLFLALSVTALVLITERN